MTDEDEDEEERMPDVLGWRRKIGVLVPGPNSVMEPEIHRMLVPGVTAHLSRIHIRQVSLANDDDMQALIAEARAQIYPAIDCVKTADVDYLVIGMASESFWDGAAANRRWVEDLEAYAGVKVATGSEACERALAAFGVKRIAVVTPYQPIGDRNVVRFFTDLGVEVRRIEGLRCPSAVAIAQVPEDRLRSALQALDGDDVDALVQVGTNLSMVRLADEAERWLHKPVIAVNAATWWLALRQNGIPDKLYGCGRLLAEH